MWAWLAIMPKLETTEIVELGIETASEFVEGDIAMSTHEAGHEANTTQQDVDKPTDKAEMDNSHFSTSSASVTTSQTPGGAASALFPEANDGNITANEDVLRFTAPVQPSDSDETVTNGDSKQQSHSQASEQQPQNGKTALVSGSAALQSNENGWAEKAHYIMWQLELAEKQKKTSRLKN